jgi:hypothetical protein
MRRSTRPAHSRRARCGAADIAAHPQHETPLGQQTEIAQQVAAVGRRPVAEPGEAGLFLVAQHPGDADIGDHRDRTAVEVGIQTIWGETVCGHHDPLGRDCAPGRDQPVAGAFALPQRDLGAGQDPHPQRLRAIRQRAHQPKGVYAETGADDDAAMAADALGILRRQVLDLDPVRADLAFHLDGGAGRVGQVDLAVALHGVGQPGRDAEGVQAMVALDGGGDVAGELRLAMAPDHRVVAELVRADADDAAVAPRGAPADLARLQHRTGNAELRQPDGAGEAGIAAADDGDLGGEVRSEGRRFIPGRRGGAPPAIDRLRGVVDQRVERAFHWG